MQDKENYINEIKRNLPEKIDSDFIKHYFGKISQAKLGFSF